MAASVFAGAPAQAPQVDPDATHILKRMTDYLGRLHRFSVQTQNTVEDLLKSGQRIDLDISATITVSRPNRLRAERRGDGVDQDFFYDGKQLTLSNPKDKVYATVAAPGTLEGMLAFARESLGLVVPAADLVYPNAYPLLMEGVTSAIVVGKSDIHGVQCDHLAFRRPVVDFQVWVAERGKPLPYKYVVTDTSTPALLSVSTVMREWDLSPATADTRFRFTPPPGTKAITFMRLDTGSVPKH